MIVFLCQLWLLCVSCVGQEVCLDNSKVKADTKSSGLIRCACWTKEGNRLVITISSARHSYIWDEAQETLNCTSFSAQKRSSNGAIVEETQNVLPCSGKIHLNLVLQLFDLPIVEMKHGPSLIVLIADSEGFIPIAFKAKQEIIRDGKDNFDAYGSYMFKTNFSS